MIHYTLQGEKIHVSCIQTTVLMSDTDSKAVIHIYTNIMFSLWSPFWDSLVTLQV